MKQVENNPRTKNPVMLLQMKTQTIGANSITFRGSTFSNALTDDLKTCDNIAVFKRKIIGWKGKNFSCELCR